MERLISELILEVGNLNNSVKNIEEKLVIIEKELHIKKDNNTVTSNCNGGVKSEISSVNTGIKKRSIPSNDNCEYSFENMVVGENNELAFKSALRVAKAPGEDMRLLYIYGESGMGKTHLLNSIEKYIVENNKSIKVINITIHKFINEMINSISNNTTELFNSKFYNSDVLIFDDLQNINGKEAKRSLRLY